MKSMLKLVRLSNLNSIRMTDKIRCMEWISGIYEIGNRGGVWDL